MKKIQLHFLIFFGFTFCAKADYWLPKANYPHISAASMSFSIGTKGYVGGGSNYSIATKDFWEYDTLINVWTQKADLGGTKRLGGIGFSIGNKGYIGLGADSLFLPIFKDDIWEYDPTLNSWTQKGNFPGGHRVGSVSFIIGNKAFVSTGRNDTMNVNDLWEYYSATDTWIQKANMPTVARSGAIGFAIGDKGYVGLGYTNNGTLLNDFWEFDTLSNAWSQKTNFPGIARANAIGFAIGGRGFAGIGESPWSNFNSDFYEFNPVTNTWNQNAFFGGGLRDEAICFVIGNKAYVGTGGSYPGVYSDLWQYTPDSILAPIISIASSDTNFCEKNCLDFFDLSINNPISWHWFFPGAVDTTSTLQNPINICYNNYGSFDVTLIACNAVGCDTLYLHNFINELQALMPTITQSNDTLFSTPGAAYQWWNVDSGIISGATNNYFVPTQAGDYFVIVTDFIGCSEASNVFTITGVNTLFRKQIEVYPNPFANQLTFKLSNNEESTIILYNFLSQQILQRTFTSSISLNTEHLAKGIYLYEVRNKSGVIKKGKVVKD